MRKFTYLSPKTDRQRSIFLISIFCSFPTPNEYKMIINNNVFGKVSSMICGVFDIYLLCVVYD
jgi:hypothetical protein